MMCDEVSITGYNQHNEEYPMNSKEKNIDSLYKARTAHMQWLNYIKLLVSGLKLNSEPPSPLLQDSKLGNWFYNEALHFAQFNSKQALDDMEVVMEALYNKYSKIYAIHFEHKKNIFGMKSSPSKNDLELASRYYQDIVLLSDKLKKILHTVERQMFALSMEQHDSVTNYTNNNQADEVDKVAHVVKAQSIDDTADKYINGPRG